MKLVFYILILPVFLGAQNITKSLVKANSFLFRNHIIVFGYENSPKELQFKVYKINLELNKIDSSIVGLGKQKVESFLDITTDTLHSYLNFYFQKSDSKNKASLVRLNDSLRLIAKVENFESNKINSLTTFENEIYTYKQSTYTIRTSEDSLGRQFYLNKFDLISPNQPFEYTLSWQFPLEKRDINTTHVFYANDEIVCLYVNIISGSKKGQWFLKLNSNDGTVIKGVKLNNKGDTRTYLFNSYYYNIKTKQLLITGNIYNEDQINFEENKFELKGLDKQNTYFFFTVDSLGETVNRFEKTVPFVYATPQKSTSKEQVKYIVKQKVLDQISETDFTAYYDIYNVDNSNLIYLYRTGFYVSFALNEIDVELYADKIENSLFSLNNLVTQDKNDLNGKIELTSLNQIDKLLYKWPVIDVEKFFGNDDLKLPKWILTKTDNTTLMRQYFIVTIGKKGPEHKILLEADKYTHPEIYKVNNEKILLFYANAENTGFILSLRNW